MADPINSFSGFLPENYDRYLGPLLFEPFARDLRDRIDPRGVSDILEIACGTGRLTRHLRSLFPATIRLEATDLSPAMMALAKQVLQDQPIQWKVADAQELPYSEYAFDQVICQFGVMFIPDKAKAFTEFLRVLRPGGTLLFNTWNKIARNEVVNAASEIIDRYFPDQRPEFYQSPFSFHDESLIRRLLEEAGFTDIRITLVKKTGTSPSAKEAAKGFLEGSPVIRFINEKSPEILGQLQDNLEKELAEKFGYRPLESRLEAWVVQGFKK